MRKNKMWIVLISGLIVSGCAYFLYEFIYKLPTKAEREYFNEAGEMVAKTQKVIIRKIATSEEKREVDEYIENGVYEPTVDKDAALMQHLIFQSCMEGWIKETGKINKSSLYQADGSPNLMLLYPFAIMYHFNNIADIEKISYKDWSNEMFSKIMRSARHYNRWVKKNGFTKDGRITRDTETKMLMRFLYHEMLIHFSGYATGKISD